MSEILTAYINQHEISPMPFFESFVTCNVQRYFLKKVLGNVNNSRVTLRYFILIATYITLCLKSNRFLRATQKHFLPSIIGKKLVKG